MTATLCMPRMRRDRSSPDSLSSLFYLMLVRACDLSMSIEQHILVHRRSVERSEWQLQYSHTQYMYLLLGDFKGSSQKRSHTTVHFLHFVGAEVPVEWSNQMHFLVCSSSTSNSYAKV